MNDWRTDNWAGHYPVHSDPRNYRFARHLREFDHYATYNFDGMTLEDVEVSPWKVMISLIVIITTLSFMPDIINVLTHLHEYYTIWVDGILQIRQDLQ